MVIMQRGMSDHWQNNKVTFQGLSSFHSYEAANSFQKNWLSEGQIDVFVLVETLASTIPGLTCLLWCC